MINISPLLHNISCGMFVLLWHAGLEIVMLTSQNFYYTEQIDIEMGLKCVDFLDCMSIHCEVIRNIVMSSNFLNTLYSPIFNTYIESIVSLILTAGVLRSWVYVLEIVGQLEQESSPRFKCHHHSLLSLSFCYHLLKAKS